MRDSTVISIEAYREQRTGLARAVRGRRAPKIARAAHRPRVVRRRRGGHEYYRVTCSCRRFVRLRYTRAEALEDHQAHRLAVGVP